MSQSCRPCLMILSVFFVAACVGAIAPDARADVRLPSLFSDNMVLQRNAKLPVWGWAAAGEEVTVTVDKQSAKAVTGADGRWRVTLAAMKEGGPYEMVVAGRNTQVVRNILIGEVWVCSGQSNMDVPITWAMNYQDEIKHANDDQIRLFNVASIASVKPLDDVLGGWSEAGAEAVTNFSAAGYFYARELHKRLGVPVGVIACAWGGAVIRSYMSYDALAEIPQFKADALKAIENLANYDRDLAAYRVKFDQWQREHPYQDPGNEGFAKGWADPKADVSDWKETPAPGIWQANPDLRFNGIVWFRKEVTVPAAWAGQDLRLSLGPCDDFDTTYFNNFKVGGIGPETLNHYMVPRKYVVSGSLVTAGRCVITVRIMDHGGGGGFTGMPGQMSLSPMSMPGQQPIRLDGLWRYRVEKVFQGGKATEPPWNPCGGGEMVLATIFNGKVAPLAPFAVKGAVWYQGESDVGGGGAFYRTMLAGLMADWRKHWNQEEFDFLIVQLPDCGERKAEPGESGWAELREAQMLCTAQEGSALAVTIDIGEADNIHPRNKQEVGRRLAMAAGERFYREKGLVGTGPVFGSMAVEGNKARLRFDHVGGGLAALNVHFTTSNPATAPAAAELKGFAIAGEDHKFVWAQARIEGDAVVAWSDQVAKPTAVRYAWADVPDANLYNKEGLPAGPFRTDANAAKEKK